ncbi:MAG: FHA domain-containing protein [Chloroflexota bacterium]|nr:FHA domain-containing protein [Chloroflexota bacterium]
MTDKPLHDKKPNPAENVPESSTAPADAKPSPPAENTVPPGNGAPATGAPTVEFGSSRGTQKLSDVTNNKCPNCGLVNRVGVLVCENCGSSLVAGAATVMPTTRSLQDPKMVTGRLFPDRSSDSPFSEQKLPYISAPTENKPISAPAPGNNVFEDNMILRLEITGATIPILVYPKKETLIGRRDSGSGTMPDVDLTSYAGYRMGVSRRHAIVRLQDKHLEVVDLGSSNGSSLNGVHLQAHQPYPLRDGDELTIGKMTLKVVFQSGAQRVRRF